MMLDLIDSRLATYLEEFLPPVRQLVGASELLSHRICLST